MARENDASFSDQHASEESSASDSISDEEASVASSQPAKLDTNVQHLPLGERLLLHDKAGGIKSALKGTKQLRPKRKAKKKSKHAPAEVSSRRRTKFDINASGLSLEIGKHRYQPRDPRQNKGNEMAGGSNDDFYRDIRRTEIEKIQKRLQVAKTPGKKGQKLRKKLGVVNVEHDEIMLQRFQAAAANDRHRDRKRGAVEAIRQERGRHYQPKTREIRERLQKSNSKRRKRKNKSQDAGLFPV